MSDVESGVHVQQREGLARRQLIGGLALGLAATAFPTLSPAAATPSSRLETEEFRLPWSEPGIDIYVRNKRPAGIDRSRATGSCSTYTARPILRPQPSISRSVGCRPWITSLA